MSWLLAERKIPYQAADQADMTRAGHNGKFPWHEGFFAKIGDEQNKAFRRRRQINVQYRAPPTFRTLLLLTLLSLSKRPYQWNVFVTVWLKTSPIFLADDYFSWLSLSSLLHPKNTHPLLHSRIRIVYLLPSLPPLSIRPPSYFFLSCNSPPPLTPHHVFFSYSSLLFTLYPTAPLSASKAAATLSCHFPIFSPFRNVYKGNCGSFGKPTSSWSGREKWKIFQLHKNSVETVIVCAAHEGEITTQSRSFLIISSGHE